jgi:hypothetical protein
MDDALTASSDLWGRFALTTMFVFCDRGSSLECMLSSAVGVLAQPGERYASCGKHAVGLLAVCCAAEAALNS